MAVSKYKMVSRAKMKAWMAPMAMSNSFQTTVNGTDRTPPIGQGPELPDDQGGQQGEHQAAGEQVAEQTEGQGDRLDQSPRPRS